jgi:DNA-directed RNA polymerase specialized sigma24 family protein
MKLIIDELTANYAKYKVYARKFTESEEQAEDVLHDVFITLHTKRATPLSGVSNPSAYLRVCLMNNARVKHRFVVTKHFTSIEDVELKDECDIDSLISGKQLREFVETLPIVQRETVLFVLYSGSVMDYAVKFNKDPNTVKASYRHAYLKIREKFA